MIFHFRFGKWLERLRFVFLFVLFTFAIYHVLLFAGRILEPVQQQQHPAGHAVKAFQSDTPVVMNSNRMGDRLKLFYWIGE